MSKPELTDEQFQAVNAEEGAYCVLAAAGSGKTRVLTERYVRLVLEKGYRPTEILTITFTRKAAEEMRSRIVGRLVEEGLMSAAQEAEAGPIQTIHSFLEGLLREQAFTAGLDPQFEVIDQPETDIRKQAALRRVLERDLRDHPDWIPFLRRHSGRAGYRAMRSLDGVVHQEIRRIVEQVRQTDWPLADFRQAFKSPEKVLAAWKHCIARQAGSVVDETKPMSEMVQQILAGYKKLAQKPPPWLTARISDEDEEAASVAVCHACQIASLLWDEYETQMLQDQKLDFHLLETLGVKLLGERPEASAQLRRQIKAVLVDEAQDLSPLQFKLLENLAIEETVLVGDGQQSIYGFRGANREQFVAHAAKVKTYRLTANKRSEAGILTFIDRVFGAWWSADYLPMRPPVFDLEDTSQTASTGVELWPCQSESVANSPSEVTDFIAQLVRSGVAPRDVAILVRTKDAGRKVAGCLEKLNIPFLLVIGGEKFYTRMEVHDLSCALEALVDPNDKLAFLSFLRGPFVGLSMDAIVLVARAGGDVASLTQVEGISQEDKQKIELFLNWAPRLMLYADRMPAWELISTLFSQTSFFARLAGLTYGEQAIANVRKLFQYATSLPDIRAVDFAQHIRKVQQLRHEESEAELIDLDADAVKIMTVHGAKGLEFPVVVAPEFMRPPSNPRGTQVDAGLRIVTQAHGRYKPIAHRIAEERTKSADKAEYERLFYVALTRAESRLCLSIPLAASSTPAGRVASLYGWDGVAAQGIQVSSRPKAATQ